MYTHAVVCISFTFHHKAMIYCARIDGRKLLTLDISMNLRL